MPIITYTCSHCGYVMYQPASVCPRCHVRLVLVQGPSSRASVGAGVQADGRWLKNLYAVLTSGFVFFALGYPLSKLIPSMSSGATAGISFLLGFVGLLFGGFVVRKWHGLLVFLFGPVLFILEAMLGYLLTK